MHYLPIYFKTQACFGHSFVKPARYDMTAKFSAEFDGLTNWVAPSMKVGKVWWSGPHQDGVAHMRRHRSSPVMHPSVPDQFWPWDFSSGNVIAFPARTMTPKAPLSRYIVFATSNTTEI
mmetsp:Transcript_133525/g.386507  ORF Transcript_133525/g.386507 Transcript_133525/m.386507 type:complete len:119 (-) Transcript_133525:128-484(-)